jgi:hypothetical protein
VKREPRSAKNLKRDLLMMRAHKATLDEAIRAMEQLDRVRGRSRGRNVESPCVISANRIASIAPPHSRVCVAAE